MAASCKAMGCEVQGAFFRLASGRAWSLKMPLPPLSDKSAKGWVQVIPGEGEFKGHSEGEFALTADTIDSFIANFDKRGTPLKFDYEHDTHSGTSGPKPASGHVLELSRRDGDNGAQLWAFVEWTAKAAQMIRDDEYNFCSPVFIDEFKDPVTGEQQGPTLLSIGLTDIPFLDGQAPIQLSLLGGKMRMREAIKLSAIEALDRVKAQVGPDASQQDVIDAVYEEVNKQAQRDVVKEVVAEVVGSGGAQMTDPVEDPTQMTLPEEDPTKMELPPEDPTQMQDPAVTADPLLDVLAEKTGMDRAAVLSMLLDMEDALAAELNKVAEQDGTTAEMRMSQGTDEVKALRLELQATKAEMKKLSDSEASRQKREAADRKALVVARVEGLVKDGYVLDGDRDDAVHLFLHDPARAERIYKRKVVPAGESQAGAESEASEQTIVSLDGLDPQTKALAKSFVDARVAGGDLKVCIQRAQARIAERTN